MTERFIVYGFPGAYPRVFDTTEPVIIDGKQVKDTEGIKLYKTFCDSYSMDNAEMICRALNEYVDKFDKTGK